MKEPTVDSSRFFHVRCPALHPTYSFFTSFEGVVKLWRANTTPYLFLLHIVRRLIHVVTSKKKILAFPLLNLSEYEGDSLLDTP